MSTTTLVLIRHGRSVSNAAQRVQGWLDSPLDDCGLQQARLVGERLGEKPPCAVYASPLLRAADTARAIAAACGLAVLFDERLREYHMGAWTGLTDKEIETLMPPRWFHDNDDRVGPGAETAVDMRLRVAAFLEEVTARHAGERVTVVSHGGTIGAMVSLALGMPPIRRQPFALGNTSITELSLEYGRWRLRTLNDRCHLRALSTSAETIVE